MTLVLVGINHKSAPVEVREQIAVGGDRVTELVRRLRCTFGVRECAILSTCNRSEIVALVDDDAAPAAEALLHHLLERPGVDLAPYTYAHQDEEAVQHLFRVAAGLDSMILGEGQILGQVKAAMQRAQEAGGLGTVLGKLFQWALQAGKRARTETRIAEGAVSVSSAAVDLARGIFGRLEGRTALILGAGQTGELTLRLLREAGISSVLVANRTYERASALASALGGVPVPMDRLEEALARADVVVSSTGSPEPVLHRDTVRAALRLRRQRPLFLIDIAVPRDIEPAAGQLQNVFLYNLDDLQAVVERNLGGRAEEVARVERILEAEAEGFLAWWRSLSVGPLLSELQERLEAIRAAEVARTLPRLSHLSDRDLEALELLTRGLVKRILKAPIACLKQRAAEPEGMAYLQVTRSLFGLEEADWEPVGSSDSGSTEELGRELRLVPGSSRSTA